MPAYTPARLLRILEQTYPDARCALHYRNPLELLVATMLSAQCTDERVNMVTPALSPATRTPPRMRRPCPPNSRN